MHRALGLLPQHHIKSGEIAHSCNPQLLGSGDRAIRSSRLSLELTVQEPVLHETLYYYVLFLPRVIQFKSQDFGPHLFEPQGYLLPATAALLTGLHQAN